MNNIEKIKELEEEIKKLKIQQNEFNSLPEEQRLAEAMHSKMCHSNHTDMCGWHYESWINPGYAKTEYMKKAQAILKIVDIQTALEIVNCL